MLKLYEIYMNSKLSILLTGLTSFGLRCYVDLCPASAIFNLSQRK